MGIVIKKPGQTTMVVTRGKPNSFYPRGGTLDRLERIMLTPNETWDNVVQRLLDFYDSRQEDPVKRSYTAEFKE